MLLLLACAEPDAAPLAWAPAVSVAHAPRLTTAEVSDALTTWLPYLLQLDIPIVQTAYLDITTRFGADPACPAYIEDHAGNGFRTRYWGYFEEAGSCVTTDGVYVNAYGEEYVYWTADNFGTDDWTELLLEGRLDSPEGYSLFGYSYLDDETYVYANGDQYWYRGLIGDLDWDGPLVWSGGSAEDTWLAAGYGAHLEMEATRSGTRTTVSGSGGLDGLEGPVSAIAVQDLAADSDVCALEPGGSTRVADGDGVWYDVLWDAPTADDPDRAAAACDGCGTLVLDGATIGTVCADLSFLTAWESPW